MKSQDIEIIDNLIEVHRRFIRDEAEYEYIPNALHPEMPPRKRIVYGEGKHRVCPDVSARKWEEGEEEIVP